MQWAKYAAMAYSHKTDMPIRLVGPYVWLHGTPGLFTDIGYYWAYTFFYFYSFFLFSHFLAVGSAR